MKDWRKEHSYVIKQFLLALNKSTDKFVLKGGTALKTCYGLDRFSEDIDLDGMRGSRIAPFLKTFCEARGYGYRLRKDTDTVERYFLDYGSQEHSLKIEVSYREQQRNPKNITNVNGIAVYTVDRLAKMKAAAYGARDKIRDLYDIVFICKEKFSDLSEGTKEILSDAIGAKGLEQFDYLVATQKDPLIDKEKLAFDFLEVNDKLGLLYSKEEKETLVLKEVSEKVSEGKKPSLRPKAKLSDKDISLER